MQKAIPDVLVHICKNCIPQGGELPSQWTQAGVRVRIKEMPCSGKIDAQYILHSLEGGVQGVCVVTCPRGECTLSQGNYRAEMRVKTVQRLLCEIGDDPRRTELVQCPPNATSEVIRALLGTVVQRFCGVSSALA